MAPMVAGFCFGQQGGPSAQAAQAVLLKSITDAPPAQPQEHVLVPEMNLWVQS